MSVPEGYEEVAGHELTVGDLVLSKTGMDMEVISIGPRAGRMALRFPDGREVPVAVPATAKRAVTLTVQEYLANYGIQGERLRGISGMFGKRVASAYRERYGDDAAPAQRWERVEFLGRDHLSNAYRREDHDLLNMVREKFYPSLRPDGESVPVGPSAAAVPMGGDMFDDVDPSAPRVRSGAEPEAEHEADEEATAVRERLDDDPTDDGIGEAEYRAGLALMGADITSEVLPPSAAHGPEHNGKIAKPSWIAAYEMQRCREAALPCGHELCREDAARRARTAARVGREEG